MNIDFSTSLQIVQAPNGDMEFLKRVGSVEKEEDSLLDYSKDENSISFAIEDQRRKSIFESARVQQSPQRKRREIFEKYKKTTQPPSPPREEDSDIMKIFDEVFNIGNKKSSRNPSPHDGSRTPSQQADKNSQAERKHKFSIFGKKKQVNQGEVRENGRTLIKLFTKASISPTSKLEPPQTSPFISQTSTCKPKPQSPILDRNISPIKIEVKPPEQYTRLLPKIEENQPYIPAIELDDFSYIEAANEPQRDSIILEGLLDRDLDFPEKRSSEYQIGISPKQVEKKPIQKLASPTIKATPVPSIQAIAEANRNEGSPGISSSNISVRNNEDTIQSMVMHSYHRQQSEQVQVRQFNYSNDPSKSQASISSQRHLAKQFVNIFQEQKRVPQFLRKMNQLNQVYSNLHSRNATVESINQDYQRLREQSRLAIQFLRKIASDVHQAKNRKAEWEFLCFKSLNVQLFLSRDWDTIANIENLQALRIPYPFRHKKWTFQQLNKSLKSFQGLLDYYDKLEIDGQSDHDKKLHTKIRQKYWDIQKNMVHIAEDVYSQALDCTFPLHHFLYKQYLKAPFSCHFNSREIGKLRELLSMHLDLKRKGDFLSSSVVGQRVQAKLEEEMKYMCPA